MTTVVSCSYCGKPAELVSGLAIYPERYDLHRRRFWLCLKCATYVGCHTRSRRRGFSGDEPLGSLANADLRKARRAAHAAFDPLWKSGKLTRTEAYAWLSQVLNLPLAEAHIGLLGLDACEKLVKACDALPTPANPSTNKESAV